VEGVCLYPIIDRPDWEDLNHWHNSGLWDMQLDPSGQLQRIINDDYLRAFTWAKSLLGELGCV
jgi:UDP-galactopyranose mutase